MRPSRLALFLSTAGSDFARLAVASGVDVVIVDGEHGHPLDSTLDGVCSAVHEAGGRCFVRITLDQTGMIGRLLDAGLDGLVISGVEDPADLARVADLARFVPDGMRSVNPFVVAATPIGDEDALRQSAASVELWAMAETRALLAIASARDSSVLDPGLVARWTGFVVGPYDLAAATGQVSSPDNDALVVDVTIFQDFARSNGLAMGLFSRSDDVMRRWRARGITPDLVIVGYDRDVWFAEMSRRVGQYEDQSVNDV